MGCKVVAISRSYPRSPAPTLLSPSSAPSLLQVTRRLILFGYPSDAKSLQPVAVVNLCAPAMSEVLTQLLALKQQAAAGSGGQAGTLAVDLGLVPQL